MWAGISVVAVELVLGVEGTVGGGLGLMGISR